MLKFSYSSHGILYGLVKFCVANVIGETCPIPKVPIVGRITVNMNLTSFHKLDIVGLFVTHLVFLTKYVTPNV